MPEPRFNYIITIFNKEGMIEKVLDGVLASCRKNSFIYPVLDGCTDGTEKVIDAFVKKHKLSNLKKVYTNDVHELLSINAGFRAAKHDGEGYNIVLQDDVVLDEPELERKVMDLYKWGGKKLGYVSFRLGARFAPKTVESKESVPLVDYCENAYGHGLANATMLLPGQFAYRDIPIKSPVVFPFYLIRNVGLLEEKLAPYAHDDVDYGIRCIKAGYYNGVFSIKFQSKIEWGGTRQKVHPRMAKIIAHNMEQIRGWFPKEIREIIAMPKNNKIVDIPGASTIEERKIAEEIWRENQEELDAFQKKDLRPLERVVGLVRTVGGKAVRTPKVVAKLSTQQLARQWERRHQPEYMEDLSFTEAVAKYPDPNQLYRYMHHYFYHFLPKEVREHRAYFNQEQRGFGEDAFHAMWWMLFREFKPKSALEIGVYRGQIISLWSLIAKLRGLGTKVHGISPFTPAGDTVSTYLASIDYLADVKKSYEAFELPEPTLLKALSTDTKAAEHIASEKWDVIYIDGSHDYDVALADYELCKKHLAPKGILIFDDSALDSTYRPRSYSTAGHPGPTQVVNEHVRKEMDFLGAVGHNSVFRKR